jgi:predicted aldo/keto reductase-like oxidoreductase
MIEKRPMGRTGDRSSILGFGCMRLPLNGPKPDNIDLDLAQAMLRSAIDRGVDYVDTAYPYHSAGDRMTPGASEPFVARALKDGYRERVKLATKLPSWKVTSNRHMHEILDEQLKRLEVPCIDYYLVHNINTTVWAPMKEYRVFEFLDEAVKDGRIKYPAFSFHDEYPLFEEVIKSYDWAMTQVQYNYLDRDSQPGRAGVKLAYDRGIAVVVMEPLRGGFLIKHLPDVPKEALTKARPEWSLAAWALNWLWNQPEVSVVLSGMSDMAQTDDNVKTAQAWKGGIFTSDDTETIDRATGWFSDRIKAGCTACGYCMPCPSGVDIPKNFTYLNNYFLFDADEARTRCKLFYKMLVAEGEGASHCTSCGECIEKCPQHLEIPKHLEEVVEIFSAG